MPTIDTCPTCALPAESACPCELGERRCPSGHVWHGCQKCRGVAAGRINNDVGMTNPVNWCKLCRDESDATILVAG